ncbi:DUF998 domain-containing protein [Streptomyces sp. CRN 30]|uniref:DUF998 domain-containing protein n=1 Tax=Streptomyces sp. CRN 30 TaxID=3075613 RepID=UPI002A8411DB|nr:DUF998 domain-containing protein [Streptomyces sp. CRN 30]
MRNVPSWALVSSGCAPAALIAGWTLAALPEGPAYDPLTQTISVLGAYGTPGYWVMTGAFLALGVCHLLTAWGLRTVPTAGRLALGGGGLAAFLVVLLPAPASGGSLSHGTAAAIGFTLLTAWPLLVARPGAASGTGAGARPTPVPWALRPVPAIAVSVAMTAGGIWFMVAMQRGGAAGLAERLVTTAQSAWPLVVVVSCRRSAARAQGDGTPDRSQGGGPPDRSDGAGERPARRS